MQLNSNPSPRKKKRQIEGTDEKTEITQVSPASKEIVGAGTFEIKQELTRHTDLPATIAEWERDPNTRLSHVPDALAQWEAETAHTRHTEVPAVLAQWDMESKDGPTPESVANETNAEIVDSIKRSQNVSASPEEITGVALSRKTIESRLNSPKIEYVEDKDQESEYDLITPLTLESIPTRQKLLRIEAESLYKLIIANPDNEELWKFMERCSRFPGTATILRHNLKKSPESITQDVFESIIFLGPLREKVLDVNTGKQKSILVYGGLAIGKGGVGVVTKVIYAYEEDLTLKAGLLKTNLLDRESSKDLLLYERKVAQQISELVKKTQAEIASGKPNYLSERQFKNDPTKNILYPEVLGEDFFIMPKIENAQGESQRLRDISLKQAPVEEMATSLLGATRGLAWLSENGIIASDNSDRNIMDSKDGGVVIDLGGFISKKMLDQKDLEIISMPDSANNKEIEKPAVGVKTKDGHSAMETAEFISAHIFAEELLGKIAPGITHKITIARIIERYFGSLRLIKYSEFDQFTHAPYREKENFPPTALPAEALENPKMKKLYDLYVTLLAAYQHPTRFIGGKLENGLDSGFMSMEDIEDALLDIIKN